MSDYISKHDASLGTEVLSDQLIDETQRHAKTAAENVLLRGEAARLRKALEEAELCFSGRASYDSLDGVLNEMLEVIRKALSGDTEPVGDCEDSFDDDLVKSMNEGPIVFDDENAGINTGEGQQSGDS